MLEKINSQSSIYNPNKYGPVKGQYFMDKFMIDFEKEVKLLFEKNYIQKEFVVNNSKLINDQKLISEYTNKVCLNYDCFIGIIRPVINSDNFKAVRLLKAPMALFFEENNDNVDEILKLFADSFMNVIQFWKNYDL